MGVLLPCLCRLGLNETHKDIYSLVNHLVDSILCTQWRTVAKSHDPVAWAIGRRHELELVMPKANLTKICQCLAGQLSTVQQDMVKCIEAGSELASLLFSSSVEAAMEGDIRKAMEGELDKFVKEARGEVNKQNVDDTLAAMLEAVDKLGSGYTPQTHAYENLFE